jgi:hypothetical protein
MVLQVAQFIAAGAFNGFIPDHRPIPKGGSIGYTISFNCTNHSEAGV